MDKEDGHAIEEYVDNRLDEMTEKLIFVKCPPTKEEIVKHTAKYTSERRKILRQQRAMEMLEKEQKMEEKRRAEFMDIDEVKDVAKHGAVAAKRPINKPGNTQNDDNHNHNHNNNHNKNHNNSFRKNRNSNNGNSNRNRNIKEENKDKESLMDGFSAFDIMDESEDELRLPKKKKANLRSFGLGNASQSLRENIINSQADGDEDEDEENDDDLDLRGLSQYAPTPKSLSQVKGTQESRKKSVEPQRKKRKISGTQKSNDVINSLLGYDDNDEDDDVDMDKNKNKNKNKNRNVGVSQRSVRSQRSQRSVGQRSQRSQRNDGFDPDELLSGNPVRSSSHNSQNNGTLDGFIISSIPPDSQIVPDDGSDDDGVDRKDKKNSKMEMDDDGRDSNNNNNNGSRLSQTQSQRKSKRGRGKKSQDKDAWGSLMKMRGKSQRK